MNRIFKVFLIVISISSSHAFADGWTLYQTISRIYLQPNGSGFDIFVESKEYSGTWGIFDCTNPRVVKVEYNAGYSKEYLSLLLTVKSFGRKVSFGYSGSCSGDAQLVDKVVLD